MVLYSGIVKGFYQINLLCSFNIANVGILCIIPNICEKHGRCVVKICVCYAELYSMTYFNFAVIFVILTNLRKPVYMGSITSVTKTNFISDIIAVVVV